MYEVNRVYIWQNQADKSACLNGTETVILGPKELFINVYDGKEYWGWPTDTDDPADPNIQMMAEPGDLRPKDPPPGEQRILDLFHQPELETA